MKTISELVEGNHANIDRLVERNHSINHDKIKSLIEHNHNFLYERIRFFRFYRC
jgi:hypothetical protein